MTREALTVPASLWDAPPPPLRRDARRAAVGLPAAAPVAHAVSAPGVHAGRLAVGFAAVAVIGVVSAAAGMLAFATPRGEAPLAGIATELPSDASAEESSSAASLAAEGGAHSDADLRVPSGEQPDAGGIVPVDDRAESGSGTQGDGGATGPDAPVTPGTDAPAPGASDPGTSNPGPSDPGPSQPAPGPTSPAPAPTQPAPSQPTPPPPAPPKPLAFVDLTANYGVNLLGIRLLSSYTLTLAGEPGSTASVTYGGRAAGSVAFNGDGRASLKIGGSLLELSNPLVRVAYSDGTSGSAIEARRDSI